MTSRLNWGLDVGIYGPLASAQNVLQLATLAEKSGFDSIWLADHVVFPVNIQSRYPYSASGTFPVPASMPILEPIATMGVLVGATKRVKIGTAVLVMPYRNPVVLAKMFSTLDQFSGGRIILGAGVGWLEEEFQALASPPFAERGLVTDEFLEVFKRVTAGGEVQYQGHHYQLEPCFANPPSLQRPHPPILIGGTSGPALRRAARYGDGWLSVALEPHELALKITQLRGLCEAQEREPDSVTVVHKLFIDLDQVRVGVNGSREMGTGTTTQVIDDLKRITDLGITDLIVRYIGNDIGTQEQQLQRFVEEVMPWV